MHSFAGYFLAGKRVWVIDNNYFGDNKKICLEIMQDWNVKADKKWIETQEGLVVAENIKAGEVLDISASFDYGEAALEGTSIVIWYDVGDADRPAIFKLVRD